MANFKVSRISEINTRTGHCVVHLDDHPRPVTGRINDPELQRPNNVYTQALDNHGGFVARAKAVRKEGEVQRLYIMDAEPLR